MANKRKHPQNRQERMLLNKQKEVVKNKPKPKKKPVIRAIPDTGEEEEDGDKNGIRFVECTISKDNIENQIIAFLYAVGIVKDNEDVLSLKFLPRKENIDKTLVPLKIKIANKAY